MPPNNTLDCFLTWLELYHSIHARGENIEEVLAAAESNETTAGGTALSGVATENGNLNLQERNSDLPEDMAFEKGEINDRDMSQDLDLSRAAPPDSSPTKPSVSAALAILYKSCY